MWYESYDMIILHIMSVTYLQNIVQGLGAEGFTGTEKSIAGIIHLMGFTPRCLGIPR